MNQIIPYQPYRKFEVAFINQLVKQGSSYLVAQSYQRALHEMADHTKTPILFTPYKNTGDAVSHFEYLQNKGEGKAAYVDIRKNAVGAKLVNMCYGLSDQVPYISMVKNVQQTINHKRHSVGIIATIMHFSHQVIRSYRIEIIGSKRSVVFPVKPMTVYSRNRKNGATNHFH